jgi:hypothetical protein
VFRDKLRGINSYQIYSFIVYNQISVMFFLLKIDPKSEKFFIEHNIWQSFRIRRSNAQNSTEILGIKYFFILLQIFSF